MDFCVFWGDWKRSHPARSPGFSRSAVVTRAATIATVLVPELQGVMRSKGSGRALLDVVDESILAEPLAAPKPEREEEKTGLRVVAPSAVDEGLHCPAILETAATDDAQAALVGKAERKAVKRLGV